MLQHLVEVVEITNKFTFTEGQQILLGQDAGNSE